MKRIVFLALLLFVIPHPAFSVQPNLIWVMADDLGYSARSDSPDWVPKWQGGKKTKD